IPQMFEGVKFEVSRLYLSYFFFLPSSFCLLPSALCLPSTKITKSCQEPHYPLSDTFGHVMVQNLVTQGVKSHSLLVSIARSFPVGAIMLLEAGGDAKFKARPVEGVDPTQATLDKLKKLILDGQQRLTSLTQVLIFKQPVQTRDSKKKLVQRYYYIDIETALLGPEHYESAIISIDANRIQKENFGRDVKLDLSTPEKEYEHFYFPCNQILNAGAWEVGLNKYDANHGSNKLSRYMEFRIQVLDEYINIAVCSSVRYKNFAEMIWQ
uniref:GmrSD restriction endonuclease domain-containing protein n=1 Tax=uncultured Nostoc sp. TaxID=340711 RepID=UPI0035C9C5C7